MSKWFFLAAVAVLVSVSTAQVVQAEPYKRSLYKHWVDADSDCQDTRQEGLIAERTIAVRLESRGCKVLSRRWHDPYTDAVFTDPKKLDIDHFIPLKEVHRS